MKAVILLQHKIYDNLVFDSVQMARNYIVMQNPKRRFKEDEENKFTCKRYGTTFRIIELKEY